MTWLSWPPSCSLWLSVVTSSEVADTENSSSLDVRFKECIIIHHQRSPWVAMGWCCCCPLIAVMPPLMPTDSCTKTPCPAHSRCHCYSNSCQYPHFSTCSYCWGCKQQSSQDSFVLTQCHQCFGASCFFFICFIFFLLTRATMAVLLWGTGQLRWGTLCSTQNYPPSGPGSFSWIPKDTLWSTLSLECIFFPEALWFHLHVTHTEVTSPSDIPES